ncbi:acyltransferase family protein, partial [Escherichia coli]
IKLSRLEYIEILFLTISIVANILTYQNNSIIFEILPFMKTLARPEMVVFAMGMFMYRLYLLGAMLKKTIALTILTLFIPTFLLCEYFNITTNMGGGMASSFDMGVFRFLWCLGSVEP